MSGTKAANMEVERTSSTDSMDGSQSSETEAAAGSESGAGKRRRTGHVLRLFLRSPLVTGKQDVEIGSWETLRSLRRLARRHFRARNIRLLHEGAELRTWDASLADTGLQSGATVNVIPKLRSGPDRARLLRVDSISDDTLDEEDNRKAVGALHAILTGASLDHLARREKRIAERRKVDEKEAIRRATAASLASKPARKEENRRTREKVSSLITRQRSRSASQKPVIGAASAAPARPEPVSPTSDASTSLGSTDSGGGCSLKEGGAAVAGGKCAKCEREMRAGEGMVCRCEGVFCSRHRNPDRHACRLFRI